MNVDERVTDALQVHLGRVEVAPGDPRAAMASGSRLRRRRRATWAVAVLATGAVAAGLSVGLVGGDLSEKPGPASTGQWTELPAPPLSPRTGGVAVWTGTEAIFLGGEIDNHCPPNAGCTRPGTNARDGATYDPATRTWRAIAEAPVTVAAWTPHTVAGDVLVIVSEDHTWHAYDASEDQWSDLPAPPVRSDLHGSALSAAGGSLVVLGERGAVQVLDLSEQSWRTLPPSPHEPRLRAHAAVATSEGIVVIGQDSTAPNDGSVPSYLLAEVYRDGEWHRAERSDMVGGYTWHWTGDRLVSPSPFCADGGETNGYGRCIPEGGILDPATGTWAPLPPGPEGASSSWSLNAAGGPWMLGGDHLYDDAAESWTRLGPPPGFGRYSDATSVVADETVIAFGGIDWSSENPDGLTTNRAWMWTPA